MLRKGVVTALLRTENKMSALLDSGQTISATPINEWPPPRSVCMFDEMAPGSWYCVGTLGNRRTVLHEDFLTVDNTIGTTDRLCDTHWRLVGTLGALGGDLDYAGQGRALITTAINNYLGLIKYEDACYLPSDAALWLSARILAVAGSSHLFAVGWMNDSTVDFSAAAAGDAAVRVFADSTLGFTGFQLEAALNTGGTTVSTGIAMAANTWFDIDIVCVASTFASGWVNGSGPTTSTTNVPGNTAPGLQPAIVSYGRSGFVTNFVCDWIHVEQFAAYVAP